MRRIALTLLLLAHLGCWGADDPFIPSCTIDSASACVAYEEDEYTARMSCAAAGGAYSTLGCPYAGRVGDCTATNASLAYSTITSYYAPVTQAEARSQCPAMPVDGWVYEFMAR